MGFFLSDLINSAEQAANNVFHPQQQQQRQQVQNAVAQQAPKMLTPQAQQQWAAQRMPQQAQPDFGRALGQIGGFLGGIGTGMVNDVAKGVNTGLGAGQMLGNNLDALIAHATGNNQLANHFANQQTLLQQHGGLLNQGAATTQQQITHDNPAQALGQGAQTGLHYGQYAVPYGSIAKATLPVAGAIASKLGGGVAAQVAGKLGQYGTEYAANVPIQAGLNAANQMATTGKFNANQATQAGLTNAAMIPALHAAGDTASVASKQLTADIHSAALNHADNIARQAASSNIPAAAESHTVVQKPGVQLNPNLVAQHEQLGASGHANHIIVTKNADGSYTPATEVGAHQLAAYQNLGATHMPIKEVTPGQLRAIQQRGSVSAQKIVSPNQASLDLGMNKVESTPVTPTAKVRGLTKGIQSSPEFTPQLQKQVSSSYTPFTDKAANASTADFMKQPLDQAKAQVMDAVAHGSGVHLPGASGSINVHFGKQEVSNAGAVMKALDQAGRHDEAQAVHDALAQKLTNAGQTSQAAKLIYNRTPAGLMNMARTKLGSAGIKITPENQAKLNTLQKNISNAQEGTRAHDLAIAQFQQAVAKQIPTGAGTKALSLYKTGILSSPKTAVKIAVANPIQAVGENIKDIPAAAVDKAVSLFTGKRSVVAPNPQNLASYGKTFAGKGMKDAKQRLVNNITMPNSSGMGMGELSGTAAHADGANFGVGKNGAPTKLDQLTHGVSSKVLNGYTSSIGRVHGSIQTPFYEARYQQSLTQSAQVEALNRGLKGAEKQAFIKNYVANPSKSAQAIAESEAGHATNQMKTAIGSAASGIQRTLPGGQIIAPITRVPGAVATQVINYSPLGFVKTIGSAALDKRAGNPFDQQAFSRGIGRAVVGTGALAGGAALYSQGRMSGDFPSDKGTQALWQSANIPANSVYVGGKAYPNEPWRNTGGTWQQIGSPGGAAAQSALTGAATVEGYKKGGIPGAALGGLAGGTKIVTNQPYLTGISGAMGVATNPSQSKSFLDQTTGSVVPNIIKDVASSTDPLQRQTSVGSIPQSMLNSITNGIPGLREQNQPQVDTFGNVLPRNNGPLTAALNPFNPQTSRQSQLTDVLGAIHNTNDQNGKPLTIPSQVNKNIPIKDQNGVKTNLTDPQRTQYIQNSGQASQNELNQLINTSSFKNATPAQQSKMVSDVVSGQRNVALINMGNQGKLSSAGKAAINGTLPSTTTAGKVTTGTNKVLAKNLDAQSASILKQYDSMSAGDRTKALASSNDAQYKYDLAKYNNDKANNSLTKVQDLNRQYALAKEKVGANFNPTIRSVYGLSKAKLAAYLNNDPNAQQTASQLLAYDQALKDAGITKGKYNTGLTTSTRTASTRTTSTKTTKAKSTKSTSGVSAATKAAITADNTTTKNMISDTGAIEKKVASAKVGAPKAKLPSGKSTGVKLASFKKASATPKISMKRRT